MEEEQDEKTRNAAKVMGGDDAPNILGEKTSGCTGATVALQLDPSTHLT
jgi:hypothetical protein